MAMVVVLPAPLPPSRPVIEPAARRNEMPSTAASALVELDQAVDGDGGGVLRVHGTQDVTPRRGKRKPCVLRRRFNAAAADFTLPPMSVLGFAQNHPRRNVRLDTLVRLRWLAVIGQTTAVLVVYTGLDFELPIWACLSVIALSAWLNVALRLGFHMTQRLEPDRAAWLLGLRHRRAGGAALSHRRFAEPVRLSVSRRRCCCRRPRCRRALR